MANPLGDLLEWLFAANITTSDAFVSAKAFLEANVTRDTIEQVAMPAARPHAGDLLHLGVAEVVHRRLRGDALRDEDEAHGVRPAVLRAVT